MSTNSPNVINLVELQRCMELVHAVGNNLTEAERAAYNQRDKDAKRMVEQTRVLARSLLARISGV